MNEGGYGVTRSDLALRVAYRMTRGEIPIGKNVLHLCHRRCCVQPAHLYAGDAEDNSKDRKLRYSEVGQSIGFGFEYDSLIREGMKYYGWPQSLDHEMGKIVCTQANGAGSEQSMKCSRARIANALATAYLPALPDLHLPLKPLFANTRRAFAMREYLTVKSQPPARDSGRRHWPAASGAACGTGA